MNNNESITIGAFNPEHMNQMVEIFKELAPGNCSMETFTQNYLSIRNNRNYYIVEASIGDELVGTAMGICITSLDGNFLVVENVIVSDRHRGLGIGRLIFDELDKYAVDNKCGYAILVSSAFRKGAHKFYESLGYVDDVRGFRKVY